MTTRSHLIASAATWYCLIDCGVPYSLAGVSHGALVAVKNIYYYTFPYETLKNLDITPEDLVGRENLEVFLLFQSISSIFAASSSSFLFYGIMAMAVWYEDEQSKTRVDITRGPFC